MPGWTSARAQSSLPADRRMHRGCMHFLSRFLHPGYNQLRIVVANTAINEIAGASLPSYKLLNLRYGERFTPQGFENIMPLPSGILKPVRLQWEQVK